MDKKSSLIGAICLLVAFFLMAWDSAPIPRNYPPAPTLEPVEHHRAPEVASIDDVGIEVKPEPVEEKVVPKPASFVHLENDEICVCLSSLGAGIQDVQIKQYPKKRKGTEPFVFNESAPWPALSLAFGQHDRWLLGNYTVTQRTPTHVVFQKRLKSGIVVEREYRLSQGDNAYVIDTATRLKNNSPKNLGLGDVFIHLGYFPTTEGDMMGEYLNFGYYDGKKAHFLTRNDFRASSGFLGLGKASAKNVITGDDKVVWGSVKNQFFTGIYTPKTPGNGFVALPKELENTTSNEESVMGSLRFPVGVLQSGQVKSLEGEFYIGPKDYVLLDRLGQDQDLVMQFGVFGFVSKMLLLLMKGIYTLIGNWGVTVILLTVIVKLLLWPLTTAQVRSSRKMTRLQEPLKKLKEKYRDNPQKLQAETLKLFKDNRVNPAAGCLPVFIQIPIFLGLYFTLRTTAEMRFASFLWIPDLSLPDTVVRIGAFPINILPLIMTASMIWQMKVMPSVSVDGAQKWVFKLMPVLFLVFCYNFPAALVLYWTVQNLLTILQQMILNKKNDEALLLDDMGAVGTKKRKNF
ncbi:MAG: membrane protein insertase YidC [Verrucomicrobiota bacterium]|nr:MAG: membrane protein insertase YidC [Verrucomicrobiota bacterium]